MIEESGAEPKIPTKPAARQAWVIYQLKLRGVSLRQLAFKHGFAPNTVSQALVRPHSHVERILAEALELTPQQLFPDGDCTRPFRRSLQPTERSRQYGLGRPHRHGADRSLRGSRP